MEMQMLKEIGLLDARLKSAFLIHFGNPDIHFSFETTFSNRILNSMISIFINS